MLDHKNKNMELWLKVFSFLGIFALLTRMQARMASILIVQCIYCLHNLNIQLALLNYQHQISQRRQRRLQRWHNPYWCIGGIWPNGSWFEIHFRSWARPWCICSLILLMECLLSPAVRWKDVVRLWFITINGRWKALEAIYGHERSISWQVWHQNQ